jgi:hypothetical protein
MVGVDGMSVVFCHLAVAAYAKWQKNAGPNAGPRPTGLAQG